MSTIARATSLPDGTLAALALGSVVTLAGLAVAILSAELGAVFATVAVVSYAVVAVVVLATIGRTHGVAGFGLPNAVTLTRASATALVAGYAGEVLFGFDPTTGTAAAFAALAGLSILADGLDGRIARTRGPATPFGARFDMETDAAMILVLSILAFALGKVGAWVLLIGAMRYAFVAAGTVAPWLAAPLPPSLRRKAVCVLQGAALVALAVPGFSGRPAEILAATALAALAWSFAVDVRHLVAARSR
jgi:phosphatidylglycerophosphate synthase